MITRARQARPAGLFTPLHMLTSNDAYTLTPNDGQHLVLNAVVLWNTRYTDAALAQLRAAGHPIADEDAARLSPLAFAHINMLGRYAFTPRPDAELRPLRDPNSPDDE